MEIFKNSQEQIKSSREKLLELEKEGKYVFHGTAVSVDELIPMQAENNNEKDRNPAIHASPYADVAIFMALMKKKEAPNESNVSCGTNDGVMYFGVTKNLLEDAKNIIAKVYVLDRENFKDFQGTECCLLYTSDA